MRGHCRRRDGARDGVDKGDDFRRSEFAQLCDLIIPPQIVIFKPNRMQPARRAGTAASLYWPVETAGRAKQTHQQLHPVEALELDQADP